MKVLHQVLLIIIACYCSNAQTSILTLGSYSGPTTYSEDPNLNKDWDWELGDVLSGGVPRYIIFLQDRPNATNEYEAVLPWYQQSSWNGLEDRKKDDGWILLARDFGTPERRLKGTNPYFVIYNKYRSIIRIFILLLNVPASFTYSTIELKTWHKGSGVLAHLSPIAFAMDSVKKTYENATSAAVTSLSLNNYWVYADFPIAFDNTLSPSISSSIPPSLIFNVYGTIMSDISLEMSSFSAQGDKKFITDFMAKNKFGSPGFSLNAKTMPSIDIPFNLPDVSIKATAPNWEMMRDFFGNLKLDLNLDNIQISPLYKDLINTFSASLSLFSISSPISISGLDLGSIFQFFIGGGLKKQNVNQTGPTFITTHYSAVGTMTTMNRFASVTIPVPNTRSNYKEPFNGGEVGIVQNEPLGILTLKETPKVYKKIYTFNINTTPQIKGEMLEYEIGEIPKIILNEKANIEIIDIDICIVAPLIPKQRSILDNPSSLEFIKKFCEIERITRNAKYTNNQNILIEFDSPIDGSNGYFRSMPVPIQYSKGRTLQLPSSLSIYDLKLVLKATFKRLDDQYAQPIVLITKYEVDIIERSDLSSEKALPTIPPRNVISSFNAAGGVNISWDRNREKNIKHYAIERSINGNSFLQIATTQDTVFNDMEIQKAVNVYSKYIKNVNVSYKVRALSEWKDESNVIHSQYSNYSDIVSAYGSYSISQFNKKDKSPNMPENNLVSQNFPNPFNPYTTIYYAVKDEGHITVKVYNSLGQEIATLVDEKKDVGYHYTEWNAAGYTSGIYFYRITNGYYSETRRMVLTK
jgi:hypothetical protein